MIQTSRRDILTGLTALTATSLLGGLAHAQTYPQRPIKIVVPYAAGGASDIVARLVAVPMGQDLGQSLYVDNRGGGASQIGTQAIASSAPDGTTIGVVDSAFTINPGLFGAKLPYDTVRDFTPISLLARTSLVLVVPASLPVSTVTELIALGKAKPGSLTMATAGIGTAVHLGCEQFRQEAGLDVVSVPYRGGGPAIMDLIAGKVDFNFSTIPAVLEQIRTGKLKVDAAPDFGLVGPAGLPPDILAKLAKAAQAAVRDEATRKRMEEIGYQPIGSTPAEYAAHIATMIDKWKHIITVGNIKPE